VNVWEKSIRDYINNLQETKPIVFVSDFNVAPAEIDIHKVNGHTRSAGFTIEERTTFAKMLDECNIVDSYRVLHPNTKKYTWFSNFAKSRENNKGWRIDTCLISKKLVKQLKNVTILDDFYGSDHVPVMIELF
jgi:exodeoxyribonuclease-3